MANSNSVLSPHEIHPISQENKHLGKFSYFTMKYNDMCTHQGDTNEYTQHTIAV